MSLVCDVSFGRIRLGMLRVTSELLRDIREGQKSDPFLSAKLESIVVGRERNFNVGSNGILRL